MKNDRDNTKKEFREERAGFRQKLHQEIAEAKPAKIAAENESRRLKKRSQGQGRAGADAEICAFLSKNRAPLIIKIIRAKTGKRKG